MCARMFPLMIIFLYISVTGQAAEIVRLSNGEWPPYLSEKLPNQGAASHIVRLAFKEVGLETEYIFKPWKRSYLYAERGFAENGVCHGSVVWVYTPQRSKSFYYTNVVIEETEVLFYRKNNPVVWESVDDLAGKKIGGTMHTAYPLFEEAEKRGIFTLQRAGNYDTLFERLLAGRIDAIPQVYHVGQHFLRNNLTESQREEIAFHPRIVDNRKYHLIISKKSDPDARLVNLFNRGLERIKNNGLYDQVLSDITKGLYYDYK